MRLSRPYCENELLPWTELDSRLFSQWPLEVSQSFPHRPQQRNKICQIADRLAGYISQKLFHCVRWLCNCIGCRVVPTHLALLREHKHTHTRQSRVTRPRRQTLLYAIVPVDSIKPSQTHTHRHWHAQQKVEIEGWLSQHKSTKP